MTWCHTETARVVIAKYPDKATMDAVLELAKQAFGRMIEEGVVDGDSVHPHTGSVFKSLKICEK